MSSSSISLSSAPVELVPASPQWPAGLSALKEPPTAIRVAGLLPDLTDAVAIVGTRFADEEAMGFTRQLAATLALRGLVIISGGARGIDAAAHEGALSVGGKTIAVLASGLARAYPPEHGPLFSEVALHGALISEGPDTAQPFGFEFLRRNRLIAALASCVVVVQAPLKSGALSTASWAKRLKKRVFAVPGAPWEPRGRGTLMLLQRGAAICTSAADVLSVAASKSAQTALPGMALAREPKNDAGLPEASCRVLKAFEAGRRHPDDLVLTLDMSVAEVQEALLILVLGGLLTQAGDGTYVRARD